MRFLKILASLLLLLNGIGALYGGMNLIMNPDGSSINLPLDLLDDSPFINYFIPGIILFTTIGLFSLFICVALLLKLRNYSRFIMAQGAILVGWILIQIILIHNINSLQIIFGILGVVLLGLGWMLRDNRLVNRIE
jgi:hypothetical protein